MATLAQVRDRANTWLANRWPVVQARQEAYFAAHGRYWQGKKLMAVAPNHTTANYADAVAELLADTPTDQVESWLDMFPEFDGAAIPALFVFDTYESPAGHGYVCHVYAGYNGNVYHRAQGVGPEDRTVAWHVVVAE